jgi:hypothetical protein
MVLDLRNIAQRSTPLASTDSREGLYARIFGRPMTM